MKSDRLSFLKNTKILGLVTFVNKLKSDAHNTIFNLEDSGVNTKMITGDNIFLGIKTAFVAGIIDQNKKIIVVEGHRFDKSSNGVTVL